MLAGKLADLPHGPALSGGVFRNSFYFSPWLDYTPVRRLHLSLSGRGRLALVVAQSALPDGPSMVLSREVVLGDEGPTRVRLPNLDNYAPHGRLFWDLRALSPDAEVGSVEFVTDQQPPGRARLAVLIRTFGRTSDVIRLLGRLVEQAATAEHRDFLRDTSFVVLDTTPDALPDYQGLLAGASLNLAVMDGRNLGGGGNAAQVLFRFLNSAGSHGFDDVVMTDDDLDITLESLCRYRAFARFRTRDVVTTCPILMKSEPQVVWEDGGFWGRFHPSRMTPERASVFPRLLKHGWRLSNQDHLDDFGVPTRPEYATFIFFAGPTGVFRRLGYPTAFFLRGDDIEYSLRAKYAGVEMISNPNLCAWHEPGHSYGQEYMAILHGIIVNMHYGRTHDGHKHDGHKHDGHRHDGLGHDGHLAREPFTRFFNSRLQAHASIRDGLGLRVYVEVLEALTGTLPVLQPGFDAMYLRSLAELKTLEASYEKLDRSIITDLLADKRQQVRLLPFLHMRAGDFEDVDLVILENHPQKTFHFRPMRDEAQDRVFYRNLRRFGDLLGEFVDRFDEIAAALSERLAATRSEAFWTPFFADAPYALHTSRRSCEADAEPPRYLLPLRMPREPKASDAVARTPVLAMLRRAVVTKPRDRLPDGFDEETYLRLNPDVANASMSARAHYLNHGKDEGRPWKLEGSV